MNNGPLNGAVVAVAGAAGPAGRAALLRLAEAGAIVVGADADAERLAEAVDAARYAHGGATVTGDTVDLLDLAGHPGLGRPHREGLRPGRRPGPPRRRLARQHLLPRDRPGRLGPPGEAADPTVQHTSLAFHDGAAAQRPGPLRAGQRSPARTSPPRATPRTPRPRPPPRRGRWRSATPSARRGATNGPQAAAAILVIKALVHDAMRAERPEREVRGLHRRHGPGRGHRRTSGTGPPRK